MARVRSSPVPPKFLPVSSSGLGWLTFNQQTGVQFSSPVPCVPSVPFVQWIRIERYERSDSGSTPERDTKVWFEVFVTKEWWPSGTGHSLSMRTRWVRLPSTSPSSTSKAGWIWSGDRVGLKSQRDRSTRFPATNFWRMQVGPLPDGRGLVRVPSRDRQGAVVQPFSISTNQGSS